MYQILAQIKNFDFLDQICPQKEHFRSKTEKMHIYIESYIFELV